MIFVRPLVWRGVRLLVVVAFVGATMGALHPVLERWVPAMRQSVLASDRISIPLIDRQAPKQVATATFALG